MSRPSWIEVDLHAVARNVRVLSDEVVPARLCAVVKADAYGHGDVPVAEAALANGATWLAVALVEEGRRLRDAGIEAPILVLSEPILDDAQSTFDWRLTPTVYTMEFVDRYADVAAAAGAIAAVHLKLDTGMHRVGATPLNSFEIARAISRSEHLRFEGLWTHLAVAEEDQEFSMAQVASLIGFKEALAKEGIKPDIVHAANSAAAMEYPDARLDMVRCGIALYGLRPAPATAPHVALQPAMRVVSHVTSLRRLPAGARPSYGRRRSMPAAGTVATVPIGYADGFVRLLSFRDGEVLIRGRRYPLAGTVTMDQIVVDVADDRVEIGDEVVIIGLSGGEEITADEWAGKLETINYEVVCQFGPRLPRRYPA